MYGRKIITALAALTIMAGITTTALAGDRRDDRRDDRQPGRGEVAPARDMHRQPVREVRRPTGHWETRTVLVLVEAGHWEWRTIPALYELRIDFSGRHIFVCVQPERTERVWIPARYEYRTERYWVEDRPHRW